MSATDELRRMLDERGAEWYARDSAFRSITYWRTNDGVTVRFAEKMDVPYPPSNTPQTITAGLTPEQAVEATLGRAYEPPVAAARWDGDVLILTIPRDPSSIHVQRSESRPRKVYAEETKVIAATLERAYEPPYGELIEALRRDWDIEASWDGLRRFWYIGLTEEGMRKRDEREATPGRGECCSDNNPPLLYDDPWRVFRCSACHHKVNLMHNPRPNYCPNCGRKVVGG